MKWTIYLLAWFSIAVCDAAHAESKLVKLGTTTSVKASGLLAVLKPAFERDTGYQLQTQAVGSGKAIQLARDGAFDVLVVHAPAAEKQLIAQGYADRRIPFMRNFFLIVGPPPDPAHVKDTTDAREAFRRIASTKSLFVSRGDDSGTHQLEVGLWKAAGIEPAGAWYYEAGLGMDGVLKLANDKQAYTLIDDATWLANRKSSPLKVLGQDPKRLGNTYSVVMLSKKRLPRLNHDGAGAFAQWLISDKGRAIIRSMAVDGVPMFTLIPP